MASPHSCDMNAILQRIPPLFLSVIIMLLTTYNFYSVSFEWVIKCIFINSLPFKKKSSASFRKMLSTSLFHVLWSTLKVLKECMDRVFYTLYTLGKHNFFLGFLSMYSLFLQFLLTYLGFIMRIKLTAKGWTTNYKTLWAFPLFQNKRWEKLASNYLSCKNLCFYHLCLEKNNVLF